MNDYLSTSALTNFSPGAVGQDLTIGIFYLAMAFALFFNISSIYTVTRHGDSKTITYTVSIIYAAIFLSLLSSGIYTLGLIK